MYLIIGATGNTGTPTAEALLKAGKKVRVVGRSADKLQSLVDAGAEAAIGDLEDASFVKGLFEGIKAAYLMVPPSFTAPDFRAYQNTVTDNFVAGLKAHGTKYAVTLSSVGADVPEGTGVVNGLYDMEQKLNAIDGLNVLHMRAGFFQQNLLNSIQPAKQMGVLGGFPMKGDIRVPQVHVKDIAAAASEHLFALDFSGKSFRYVAGPQDVSMDEAAMTLSQEVGQTLPYTQFPDEAVRGAFQSMGVSDSVIDGYMTFSHAINEGRLMGGYQRKPEWSTPTPLSAFAKEWAAVYHAS